jgi:ribosomal protein L37E
MPADGQLRRGKSAMLCAALLEYLVIKVESLIIQPGARSSTASARFERCRQHIATHFRRLRTLTQSCRVRSTLRTVWRPTRIGPQGTADPTNLRNSPRKIFTTKARRHEGARRNFKFWISNFLFLVRLRGRMEWSADLFSGPACGAFDLAGRSSADAAIRLASEAAKRCGRASFAIRRNRWAVYAHPTCSRIQEYKMDDLLSKLSDWYAAQCDGDWEHEFGIHIGTLDNPGWSVKPVGSAVLCGPVHFGSRTVSWVRGPAECAPRPARLAGHLANCAHH